jgi:superfamily II DNA or RNA helicase
MNRFNNIDLKLTYASHLEDIPLEFYEKTFPVSKEINLFLGYFSSNAIRELSLSLSQFIVDGGRLKIITNHVYSKKDYNELIIDKSDSFDDNTKIDLLNDFESLNRKLSSYGQHFFDCLKFLKKNGRLELRPVRWMNGDAHYKHMILYDGYDYISTDGSANFTLRGLTINGEKLTVTKSWVNEECKKSIEIDYNHFNEVFQKKNKEFKYLNPSEIEQVIDEIGNSKEKEDLIIDSINLLDSDFHKKIKSIKHSREDRYNKLMFEYNSNPSFPYKEGARDYQKLAYKKWLENDRKGILNMATGTGKTITSLNFVYEQFKINNFYRLIILVPTVALLHQWIDECIKFNFLNVFSSKNKDWKSRLSKIDFDFKNFEIIQNFIFITTYSTFMRTSFQSFFKKIEKNKITLIADECHNVGTQSLVSVLPHEINYRIGLSATPERKYDLEGSNSMYDFFNSHPPCFTFSYSMLKAIKNRNLAKYFYYPIFCSLNEDELKKYKSYSKRLLMNYNDKTKTFTEEGKRLLIERKRIIHKSKDKLSKLNELLRKEESLKYTFIYVPEGKEIDYESDEDLNEDVEDKKIIKDYLDVVINSGYKARTVTGTQNDRDKTLEKFKKGKIEMLLAMKILDEGVDIPITRNAIFCSSTGNPRQFIQRRGRVLRKHESKEYSRIFDMVVIPEMDKDNNKESLMEKNIVKSEILRVANFVYSSENKISLMSSDLKTKCQEFNINLDEVIQENLDNDKKCDYEII